VSDIDTAASSDEWLARKGEIVSAFESGLTNQAVDRVVGLSLVASGAAAVAWALLGGERGPRRLWTSVLGGLLVFGGFTVLGGGALGRRHEHIAAAESDIRNQLSALDPVARAEVLKDMVAEQAAPITRRLRHE
jgi:hypothetical protein